jgi:hypothetical protein
MGIKLWRWSDRLLIETHGYCSDCFDILADPIENGSKVPKTNGAVASRPTSDSTRA